MNITTNSRSNHSEAYTVVTSGVMINKPKNTHSDISHRLHNLPVNEQDKEKFETQSKSNIAQVMATHKKLQKLKWDILKRKATNDKMN
jgi:hypothetical protein